MAEVNSLLIMVNSGADKPYNHHAAYVIAFMGKQVAKIENVTVYYGPYGIGMTRKGELAKLAIQSAVKELVAIQIEGLSPSDLPDNLEQLARFEKNKLGVNIVSCGTFHILMEPARPLMINQTSKTSLHRSSCLRRQMPYSVPIRHTISRSVRWHPQRCSGLWFRLTPVPGAEMR